MPSSAWQRKLTINSDAYLAYMQRHGGVDPTSGLITDKVNEVYKVANVMYHYELII